MQEEHFWNRNKAAFILASGTGLILTALFAKYSFGHPDFALSLAQLGNIKTYVLTVMLWVMSSVLSFLAFSKVLPEKENKVLGWSVAVISIAFFGYAGFDTALSSFFCLSPMRQVLLPYISSLRVRSFSLSRTS